jgi:hypothetical protein
MPLTRATGAVTLACGQPVPPGPSSTIAEKNGPSIGSKPKISYSSSVVGL